MIFAKHNKGGFRTQVAEKVVTVGSTVQLKVEGITPVIPFAILSDRLNGDTLDLFGEVIVPYKERLDALVSLLRTHLWKTNLA